MTNEPTIKESQLLMLERIIEVKKDVANIVIQFKELNGNVRDTILKLALTEALARENQKNVEEAHKAAIENPRENRRYIDKLFITALGSMITAVAAIIAAVIGIVCNF